MGKQFRKKRIRWLISNEKTPIDTSGGDAVGQVANDFFALMLSLTGQKNVSEVVDGFVRGMNRILHDVVLRVWDSSNADERDREVIAISDQSFGQIVISEGWVNCSQDTKAFIHDAANILSAYLSTHDATGPVGMSLIEYEDRSAKPKNRGADPSTQGDFDLDFRVAQCTHIEEVLPWRDQEAFETRLRVVVATEKPFRTN